MRVIRSRIKLELGHPQALIKVTNGSCRELCKHDFGKSFLNYITNYVWHFFVEYLFIYFIKQGLGVSNLIFENFKQLRGRISVQNTMSFVLCICRVVTHSMVFNFQQNLTNFDTVFSKPY